jgi:hypothetical protein
MFHSSIRWVLSLNWLSQKWGQVQIYSALGKETQRGMGFASQLRAVDKTMERAKGIEPLPGAWKASILPLNYTRILIMRGLHFSGNETIGSCF